MALILAWYYVSRKCVRGCSHKKTCTILLSSNTTQQYCAFTQRDAFSSSHVRCRLQDTIMDWIITTVHAPPFQSPMRLMPNQNKWSLFVYVIVLGFKKARKCFYLHASAQSTYAITKMHVSAESVLKSAHRKLMLRKIARTGNKICGKQLFLARKFVR